MTWPAVSKCITCGDSITQGILNPDRWFHTLRMFDFSLFRKPEKHEARPE